MGASITSSSLPIGFYTPIRAFCRPSHRFSLIDNACECILRPVNNRAYKELRSKFPVTSVMHWRHCMTA